MLNATLKSVKVFLQALQYTCFSIAASLLLWFTINSVASENQRQQIMDEFQKTSPDTQLWSELRVKQFEPSAAMGVLKIAQIGLEAPIVAGTSEEELNAGIGWMPESTPLGGNGNVVLAAHRDGIFRSLKDLKTGAVIEITTPTSLDRYLVTATHIVDPDDVWILKQQGYATLTLVTCYPFYFVGSAPQRFIVNADRLVDRTTISEGAETK